jgi:hypothetical protein
MIDLFSSYQRSSWPKSLKGGSQQATLLNNSVDEFLAWKRQQIEHSEMANSVNFNFLLDGSDSARHLTKLCEPENPYCFLSPKALQRSQCGEDTDPKAFLTSVLNENFFSEISSNTPPHSRPFASVSSSSMHKRISHRHFDKNNLISFGSDKAPAQPVVLDYPDSDRLLRDAGAPRHHLKQKDSPRSTFAISSPSHMKTTLCSKRSKKRYEIFEALKNETLSEKDILSKFGRSQHVSHILRDILRQGLIHRVGKGGIKDPYRYYAL